jgi:hypothetical protein
MTIRVGPGMIVVHNADKRKGVTVHDAEDICGDTDTAVVFEGSAYPEAINTADLTRIGPEIAKADPERCGAKLGNRRCIFLMTGLSNAICGRFGTDRQSLLNSASQPATGVMHEEQKPAKRPVKMYPGCQSE